VLKEIWDHKSYIDTQYEEKHEKLKEVVEDFEECLFRIEQSKFNFETIIYILQGQVEVPQLPVATDYKDAILIHTNVINEENEEIVERGDENVEVLKKIKKDKQQLRLIEF